MKEVSHKIASGVIWNMASVFPRGSATIVFSLFALAPPVLCRLLMIGFLYAGLAVVAPGSGWMTVGLGLLLGCVFYAGLLLALARRHVHWLDELIRKGLWTEFLSAKEAIA